MIAAKDAQARPEESPQPRATVPTKGGKSVNITTKGFDHAAIKDAIEAVKSGHGSELRIEFLQESSTLDPNLQTLGLMGQRLIGKPGQGIWTFGN